MNISHPCNECRILGRCIRKFCPFDITNTYLARTIEKLSDNFDATTPPSVFVGRFNYPNVNLGVISPIERNEDAWMYDSPRYWANKNMQIDEILKLRSSLVNSRTKVNVKDARLNNKFIEISQEINMAIKPVDMEITLKEKPRYNPQSDSVVSPIGLMADLKNLKLTENPKIPLQAEKVYYDTDLKAVEGIKYLYEKGFDEHFISRVLSVGNLGIKNERKLVPTRWCITAVDDIVAKNLLNEIRENKILENYALYFDGYLGNYYLITTIPEPWSYELFEGYIQKDEEFSFATDYETYNGRKTYASNTVGGYYACRLAVLEKLKELKVQASVLVLRFITDEYLFPMGVFVCREATRKSLKTKPIYFNTKREMLTYAKSFIFKKFRIDIEKVLNKSQLIKQTKLTQF